MSDPEGKVSSAPGAGVNEDDHTVQLSLTDAIGSVVGGRLMLVIANDQELTTRQLPAEGRVVVGRADSADLKVADPSMSRHHFAVQTGPEIAIEDLGSSNGTRVGDRILRVRDRAKLDVGVPVQGGQTTFVLRRVTSSPRPRRIVNHGYFELRVEEEASKIGAFSQGYAVFRLSVLESSDPVAVADAERIICSAVEPTDIVGAYGPPGQYEILMVDVTVSDAEHRARAIEDAMQAEALPVFTGLAAYPRDGASPDRLLASAAEALRGEESVEAADPSLVYGAAMARIQDVVGRVSLGRISVLVLGETGVGKEVLAKQIHVRSRRSEGPMFTLNCASLNEELLASELFGHVRGAFTGAVKDKVGLIEAANGGTVFLDEVGDVAPPIQAKLLRVLEEQSLTRVGEVQPRKVDVRFISATNRDLEQAVRQGDFREDLYYRLAGVAIVVPPLRERTDEIVPLAKTFVAAVCARDQVRPVPALSTQTVDRLLAYEWPGNIRELRNMVERAVLLCGAGRIEPEHLLLDKMISAVRSPSLPPLVGAFREEDGDMAIDDGEALSAFASTASGSNLAGRAVDRIRRSGQASEREVLRQALAQCDGNQTQAAKVLGISRGTLIKRMVQYGFARPRKPAQD